MEEHGFNTVGGVKEGGFNTEDGSGRAQFQYRGRWWKGGRFQYGGRQWKSTASIQRAVVESTRFQYGRQWWRGRFNTEAGGGEDSSNTEGGGGRFKRQV